MVSILHKHYAGDVVNLRGLSYLAQRLAKQGPRAEPGLPCVCMTCKLRMFFNEGIFFLMSVFRFLMAEKIGVFFGECFSIFKG